MGIYDSRVWMLECAARWPAKLVGTDRHGTMVTSAHGEEHPFSDFQRRPYASVENFSIGTALVD